MFQKTKLDPELGLKIHGHLLRLGIETPMISTPTQLSTKIDQIQGHFQEIMKVMGLDLKDDSLQDTPLRVAKMFVQELYWGLEPENFPKCTAIENKMHYDNMLVVKDISVMSTCEHHFATIDGKAYVAYIPAKKVLGLSKFARIVEFFSRRPQVQERLTQQIGEAVKFISETQNVAVFIKAKHYCMASRGAEQEHSLTATSYLSGEFKSEREVRNEFFDIIHAT